ncbi:hypothetical protein CMV_005545 [Castanea mollissima]|uniref:CCHC-type domain-containing protein n=1 Tax=Castanea mollissima TaxID=60419 RepID=A0A8J4VU94_9ROSI|nr:hypothetical protein CMV_005545 [Castanea mollissima]
MENIFYLSELRIVAQFGYQATTTPKAPEAARLVDAGVTKATLEPTQVPSKESEAAKEKEVSKEKEAAKDKIVKHSKPPLVAKANPPPPTSKAYNQAFAFDGNMEVDIDFDEEVKELREGFAAVKLSKDVKHRIRAVWESSLIDKVYGRSVGFNYIQTKLNALWKPTGRLDVIDLGKEFFLTRFSYKEDQDKVLRNGPWFIGEHLLLIRPQEPNFKPSTTNISSIAVDIDKPLVTNILIGGLQQPVNYEGVHMLCFSCGRIGHRKDACPYVLWSSPKEDMDVEVREDVQVSSSHVGCDMVDPLQGDAVHSTEQKDSYGLWLVVTRKRQGNRGARYKTEGSGVGVLKASGGNAYPQVGLRSNHIRIDKRTSDEAQSRNRVQSHEALPVADHGEQCMGFAIGPDLMEAIQVGSFNVGIAITQAQSALVKSKKDLARSRVFIASDKGNEVPRNSPKLTSSISTAKLINGISTPSEPKFLFTASASNELGYDPDKADFMQSVPSGDFSGEEAIGNGAVKYRCQKQQTESPCLDEDQPSLSAHQDGVGNTYGPTISNAEERSGDRGVEADGMEFEGGGVVPTFC